MTDTATGVSRKLCENCACFARMLPDGTVLSSEDEREAQAVCRRNPPGSRYVSAEEPVIRNGQVQIDSGGQVRTRPVQRLQIGYPPMAPGAVCWDGWRPLGTQPGQRCADGI